MRAFALAAVWVLGAACAVPHSEFGTRVDPGDVDAPTELPAALVAADASIGTLVTFEVTCGFMDGVFGLAAERDTDGWHLLEPDLMDLPPARPRGRLEEHCFVEDGDGALDWVGDHFDFDAGGAWHALDRVSASGWFGEAGLLNAPSPACADALAELGIEDTVALSMSVAEVVSPVAL